MTQPTYRPANKYDRSVMRGTFGRDTFVKSDVMDMCFDDIYFARLNMDKVAVGETFIDEDNVKWERVS